jgi:hypothetical protein
MLLTAQFRLLGFLLAIVGGVAFDAQFVAAASHSGYPAGRVGQVADTVRPKSTRKARAALEVIAVS